MIERHGTTSDGTRAEKSSVSATVVSFLAPEGDRRQAGVSGGTADRDVQVASSCVHALVGGSRTGSRTYVY
ncbi:hypothetical protein Ntsu_38430 [Nocardia sp. IFM 10818]